MHDSGDGFFSFRPFFIRLSLFRTFQLTEREKEREDNNNAAADLHE